MLALPGPPLTPVPTRRGVFRLCEDEGERNVRVFRTVGDAGPYKAGAFRLRGNGRCGSLYAFAVIPP